MSANPEYLQLQAALKAVGVGDYTVAIFAWQPAPFGHFNFRADGNARFEPMIRELQAVTDRYFSGPRRDEQRVEHASTEDEIPHKELWVRSLYGAKGREPLVAITMPGGEMLQMSPDEARHHAQVVLEAAEQDAFMFEFARDAFGDKAGDADQAATAMLNEFRKWREKRQRTL